MDQTAPVEHASQRPQHKRTTSSVLKSMMPKTHPRIPSSRAQTHHRSDTTDNDRSNHNSMLPPDHPHVRKHLAEDTGNRNNAPAPPRKSVDGGKGTVGGITDKSLPKSKSFMTVLEKGKGNLPEKKSVRQAEKSMKKSKSSTSLSALLSRPRSSKGSKAENRNSHIDKENLAPLSTISTAPPPIWAQFATQDLLKQTTITKIPLNDKRSIDRDIELCTHRVSSPSKDRHDHNGEQPTLSRRPEMKPRPKSECIAPRATPASFAETISGLRRSSRDTERANLSTQAHHRTHTADTSRVSISEDKATSQTQPLEYRKSGDNASNSGLTSSRRGSRVMAAVAAYNGKATELTKEPPKDVKAAVLDPKEIENAFESMLDARNVPQNTRDKMRTLDTNIKADFIKKDKFGSGSASSAEGLAMHDSRPSTGKHSQTGSDTTTAMLEGETGNSPKKSRPRSRTFTFNKGDQSPTKRQKAERPISHQRNKSGDITHTESSKSLTSAGATQASSFFNRLNKPAAPEDYIGYLKKVQKPESVEVGKINKLRQLLRNETVLWVETFIDEGGMMELVGLLYRTIKVEWR